MEKRKKYKRQKMLHKTGKLKKERYSKQKNKEKEKITDKFLKNEKWEKDKNKKRKK